MPHWLPVAVACAIIVALFAFSPNFQESAGPRTGPYAGDFLQEWLGGYLVRTGQTDQLYDVAHVQSLQHDAALIGFAFDRSRYLPTVYPPFYYCLTSPLSRLSVRSAAWVWAGLMIGCFVATAVLLGRNALARQRRLPWLFWALPVAVLFMPLLENFSSSQKGTLCLLILTATYLLLHHKRPLTAGIIFGLLAFKPQLALVIGAVMLFKGQWRFLLGTAITGAGLLALSLSMGTQACLDYLRFSIGAADYIQTAGYDLHKSHCLYGFFTLLLGCSAWPAKIATLLAGTGVIGLLARLFRGRLDTESPRFAVQFSALVIATVLLSPHLFTYDLTVLLLPMFLLSVHAANRHFSESQRPWVIVPLVAIYILPGISVALAAKTGVQLTVIVMVGLLAVLTWNRLPACQKSPRYDAPAS